MEERQHNANCQVVTGASQRQTTHFVRETRDTNMRSHNVNEDESKRERGAMITNTNSSGQKQKMWQGPFGKQEWRDAATSFSQSVLSSVTYGVQLKIVRA